MRNIILMLKHNLKIMIFKKPIFFIGSILLPVASVILLSGLIQSSSGYITYGVLDSSNSNASKAILDSMRDGETVKIKEYTEEKLKDEVKLGNINGGLIINKDFEEELLKGKLDLEVVNLKGEDKSLLNSLVKENGKNLLDLAKISKGNKDKFNSYLKEYSKEKLDIKSKGLKDNSTDNFGSIALIGFIIMSIFFRGNMGADRINNDKEDKVYERMFVSGLKPYEYYAGNILGSLTAILVQIIIIVILVSNISSISTGLSSIQLFIALFITAILAVSIGSFNVSITRTSQESSMLSNIMMMVLLMLGGCFVPISLFPKIVEKISWFLPTRWIMEMIYGLQSGGNILDFSLNIVIVLLFSIAFFLFVAYKVHTEDKIVNR